MVASSKHVKHVRLDEVFSGIECGDLYHPWAPTCFGGFLDIYKRSIRGSAQFFSVMYLLQLLANRHKVNREYVKHQAKNFLRSTLFGNSLAFVTVLSGCFFRKLFGRFYHYTVLFLPATMGGFSVLLEEKKKRELYLCAYVTMTLEYIVRQLVRAQVLKLTKLKMCVSFMFLSSTAMYLLRSRNSENSSNSYNYCFFVPSRAEGFNRTRFNQNITSHPIPACYHAGSCRNHAAKNAFKYLSIGVAVQMCRVLLPMYRIILQQPTKVLMKLFSWKNFSLSMFLGSYIAIFHIVSCLLCQYQNRHEQIHALPAGFLAGAAFWFHPRPTILLMLCTTILQQLTKRGVALGFVPRSSVLMTVLFAILNGVMFQCRVIDFDICHPFITNMIYTCSGGRADDYYAMYLKCLDTYQRRKLLENTM